MITGPAVLALVLVVAAPVGGLSKGVIVDLSHSFDSKTIYWPTESGFVPHKERDLLTDKGYYHRSNTFSAPEHGGTHVDAPAHFAKDGKTVDAIPLERLVGPAVVVDVTGKCEADRDYLISVDDLLGWEKAHVTGITLVALPMKIHSGSRGPLRAIAIVEER